MFEFLLNNLPTLVAALIVLIIFVLALFGLLRWRAATKNPNVQHLLDGLLPFVYTSITSAEKVAQDVLTKTGKALQGVDKKKVADSWYALLPPTIWVRGIPVPVSTVKQFVTREMFQELVKNTYDQLNAEVVKAQTYLRAQVDYLVPDQYEPDKQLVKYPAGMLAQGNPGDVG